MKLLTVQECAALLRLGESTIYRLIDEGKLAGFRIGPRQGGVRIAESDVLAYLERCRTGPTDRPRSKQQVTLKRL
jgi:excisionase family DNA binding protein